jgi:hypothetical protein
MKYDKYQFAASIQLSDAGEDAERSLLSVVCALMLL